LPGTSNICCAPSCLGLRPFRRATFAILFLLFFFLTSKVSLCYCEKVSLHLVSTTFAASRGRDGAGEVTTSWSLFRDTSSFSGLQEWTKYPPSRPSLENVSFWSPTLSFSAQNSFVRLSSVCPLLAPLIETCLSPAKEPLFESSSF